MKETLAVMLQLRDEGRMSRFAVGGAVAASFYMEAVATEDLDIFAFLLPEPSGLLTLTPLYARLRELGGEVRGEHVVLHGWPVQILPAYTPLVEEAVMQAQDQVFEGLKIPVVSADHLCAIALQTGRGKDYQRVFSLLETGAVDSERLRELIERFGLRERWETYVRRFT
jgi:hypothetical protein